MANVSEENNQDFSNLINPYTNKPVHTGKSVSFNQRTYDDVNYMQAKNDLLNNFNATMTKPQSVNQQALYDIPVVPEFLQEEYTKAYSENSWLDSLNIATPEEIDEWRAMGKMGIGETAQRLKSLKSAKYVPFVGTTAEVGYNLDMLSAVNRLKKGQQISETERDLLVDYLRELKEIQVRGTTLPSKALSAILESIPFMVEFGVGVAGAPETFGGSLTASGLALSKAAGKKAARKAVAKALQKAAVESTMTGTKKAISLSAAKSLYKSTYDSMLKAGASKAVKEVGAKEAAKIVAKNTPKDIVRATFGSPVLSYMTAKNTVGGVADRQLSGSMQVTDAGEAVFLEPENMALSIMKAFGTSVFDNYTETMGWAFAPITSYFAKPVRKVLPKKFFTEFDKLVSSRYGIPATQALKKFGYDGVLEEMGEELLNRFLCQTFGINGLDEYTFDGFMNNVFYANEPEQWLVEALSFAMLGGAAHATYGAANKIGEVKQQKENEKIVKKLTDLANKRIFSPEEYYLEQGLIKINGSQSEAERMLREKFEENGVDKDTADDFIRNSSELEIRKQLKEYLDDENEDADKRRKKAVNYLTDKMLQNKSYSNKDLAEKNANLFVTALEKMSEANGISIQQLIDEEAPTILNQSENSPEASTSATPKLDAYIDNLLKEFDNLPENYSDTEEIERMLSEIDILSKLQSNDDLSDEELQKANELVNELEAADWIDEVKEIRANNKYNFETNHDYMYRTEMTHDAVPIDKIKQIKEGFEQSSRTVNTDTPEFKRWFGNSKVVDENGSPLVVYHGTENNFKIFKDNGKSRKIGARVGFFFTSNKDMAVEYGNNARVMQTYLSLKNPLIVEPNSSIKIFEQDFPIKDSFDFFTQLDTVKSEQETKEELINQGYDGIILKETNVDTPFMEDIHDVYVAFYPEQIKSVNNRGTFDADNPNIYYQSAYHGTPHKFDEFSLEHIGTGEGAQAHGWGLYFAGNKDVSEKYREKLTDKRRTGNYANRYLILHDGVAIDEKLKNDIWDWLGGAARNLDNPKQKETFKENVKLSLERTKFDIEHGNSNINMVKAALDLIEKNPKISIAAFKKSDEGSKVQDKVIYRLYDYTKMAAQKENRKQNINDIKNELKDSLGKLTTAYTSYKNYFDEVSKFDLDKLELKEDENYHEGQLFEVDIPDADVLLNEDKYFKEQPKKVQDALKKLYEENYQDFYHSDAMKLAEIIYTDNTSKKYKNNLAYKEGRSIYNLLTVILGSDKQASELLNKYGIKGIKYDGHRDGECYVVFDDKAVNVLNRYYQTDYTQFSADELESIGKYRNFVAKVLSGDISQKEERQLLNIGRTPARLIEAGISSNDLAIGASIIRKAQNNKNSDHNLSQETISNVYEALYNPIAVIKAEQAKTEKNKNNRYATIIDLKNEQGDYVLVAIEADKKSGKVILNDIRSIHSRVDYYPMIDKALDDGRLLKIDIDKINDLLLSNSDIISEGAASLLNRLYQQQNGVKYYQSAYHGSPYDFNEFSTEHIGAGEGAQAHGWGLYFAENKDISEKYRDVLSERQVANRNRSLDASLNDILINDKPLLDTYDIDVASGILNVFVGRDKNSIINKLNYKIKDWKEFEKEPTYPFKDYATKKIAEYKKLKSDIENGATIKFKSEGQLFEVDIPDANVMLDEQKTFKEQSKIVKDAILKLPAKYFDANEYNLDEMSGEDIYGEIANNIIMEGNGAISQKEGEKQASLLLNNLGIKGISYNGYEDGRCYVVFDDKAIKVLNRYYQEEAQGNLFYDNLKARDLHKIKGSYLPAENLIELFKNADESTIIHEFAHWWLDRLVKYSQNNEELSADVEAVRKWVKNDGGEFTREQHEKFARGFETYIRSGYAKNNRLKKLFEDFKNALLAIYDSIMQLGFKKEDMPQIQDLFDRLLTTEHERIKATVFDKIAEIDEKIENIKEHEADEFKELDEIWRDNVAILNRKSDKKRRVDEYIELANTIPFRETKETREWKQRYKNATLDILAALSGKSRSWVANSRNWEKLQEMVGNAGDEITTRVGFDPAWAEFYPDTGVSYENDEIDGDNKLAEMAFDVMTSNDYSRTWDEKYQFDDIDGFSTKVDYLVAKVKSVKGEEKNIAFEALTTLFSDMPAMPDDAMAEITKKLIQAGEELEEDTKEDFNKKVYPSIPIVQQLQFYITKKLNDLKVYNPETRYKMRLNKSHRLYRYIKNVNSVNQAKKQIRRINEFIIDDMRSNQRSLLHKEIQKQIRVNSKLVKVGTMTKGKFDWKTNTCFAELVEMNKMTQKDAEKELGAYIQIDDAAKSEARDSFDENETGEFNKTNDFQDILKKEFLQYRSQKIQDLDVTHTIQLLHDILELKEQGRKAKSEEDFLNRTQKWNTKNNLLDILEITKQSGAQFGANWIAGVGGFANAVSLNGGTLANWESLLNAIFNKDTSRKYSLLKDEADADVYARKHMMNFYKKAAEIYNFQSPNGFDTFLDYDNMQPLIKLFQEYDNEKYSYLQQVHSINSPDGVARSSIDITRSQMITMFAWSLNDKLEQRLMTQFGVEQIRDMFENKLSKEDKDLAWALVDTCEGMREDINEVFIRTTGLSLPAVENYFPSKAERVQSDIDMYHDFFVKSTNPSFIKQRKTCNRIPMKPLSPLEILIPHINKTAKYVIMSEKVNWLNQIFKDTAIKTKMQEIWGSDNGARIYQTMINKLAACTFTNYSKGTNLIAGALDTVSRNYITSAIGFSGKVALGQLLSVINYAENMPSGVWAKGFADTIKHPVENFKYMLEHCDYLKTRLAGNSQNEVIAILTSEKDHWRTWRNFMTSNVKWGDIIAITLGGKPYVDYLMSQGMSETEAFDKFVEDTLRAQQAGTTSSISEWQTAQARNCFTRMFFAFRNTDIQYERKFVDTLIQAKRGEISKSEAFKKIMIYKVLNPFMFMSCLQNLSLFALIRSMFAGDDPDDYATNFAKSAIEALMLSGLNAYGMAGFLASIFMETLISVFDKEFKHFETSTPVLTDFERQAQKIASGDLEFADYVDALAAFGDIASGLSMTKAVNVARGVGDIAQGNVGVGATRMAGWGRYTSTKAWTGEEPERKRKKRRKKK